MKKRYIDNTNMIPTKYNDENFLPLIYDKSRNNEITNLIRSTKVLAKTNSIFKSYMKNYMNLTQVTTYKHPDVLMYPIRKNTEIMPLVKSMQNSNIKQKFTKIKKTNFEFNNISTARNKEKTNNLDLYKLSTLEEDGKCFVMDTEIYEKTKDPKNYKEYLKEKINILVQGNNENITTNLIKKFNNGTKDEVELNLYSVKISLYEKNSNKKFYIYLPFDITALIYYIKIDVFKVILTKIIKFSDNETNAFLDFDELNRILVYMKRIILTSVDVNEIKNTIISLEWITKNSVYDVVICLPLVEFFLTKRKIKFYKYIDKEYIIYLLQNSMKQWDIHIINYLSKFKRFRENLNRTLFIESEIEVISLDKLLPFDDVSNKSYIFNNRSKSHIMEYFHSDDDYYCKYYQFKSYSFYVTLSQMEKNNKFSYRFNFNHLITFEKLRVYIDLHEYLSKILVINYKNESVFLDTKYFEKVDDNNMKFLIEINKEKSIDKFISANVSYNII